MHTHAGRKNEKTILLRECACARSGSTHTASPGITLSNREREREAGGRISVQLPLFSTAAPRARRDGRARSEQQRVHDAPRSVQHEPVRSFHGGCRGVRTNALRWQPMQTYTCTHTHARARVLETHARASRMRSVLLSMYLTMATITTTTTTMTTHNNNHNNNNNNKTHVYYKPASSWRRARCTAAAATARCACCACCCSCCCSCCFKSGNHL